MKGYKRGKFLEFELDDGKKVKYDLSTGDSIGIKGKPVKSVNHKMSGFSIPEVIESIDNENYRNFLYFVNKREKNISNFGTLLKKTKDYLKYEQYFSSGLKKINAKSHGFSDCPTGLVKICRENDILLTDGLIDVYTKYPDYVNLAFHMEYITLSLQDISDILCKHFFRYGFYYFTIFYLLDTYSYDFKHLMMYIDSICTFEAISYNTVLDTLRDCDNMMSRISPKFEKYPKHLLTTHQIVVRNYNRCKQEFDESLFKKRVNPDMEFSYKNYIIIYPKTTQDIKDEAAQQNNCVASYIDRVIDGVCDIVFLRDRYNPDKSIVTVEVRDNKVVQARRAYNADPSEEELFVLKRYEEYLNNMKIKKCV